MNNINTFNRAGTRAFDEDEPTIHSIINDSEDHMVTDESDYENIQEDKSPALIHTSDSQESSSSVDSD